MAFKGTCRPPLRASVVLILETAYFLLGALSRPPPDFCPCSLLGQFGCVLMIHFLEFSLLRYCLQPGYCCWRTDASRIDSRILKPAHASVDEKKRTPGTLADVSASGGYAIFHFLGRKFAGYWVPFNSTALQTRPVSLRLNKFSSRFTRASDSSDQHPNTSPSSLNWVFRCNDRKNSRKTC